MRIGDPPEHRLTVGTMEVILHIIHIRLAINQPDRLPLDIVHKLAATRADTVIVYIPMQLCRRQISGGPDLLCRWLSRFRQVMFTEQARAQNFLEINPAMTALIFRQHSGHIRPTSYDTHSTTTDEMQVSPALRTYEMIFFILL